MTVAKKFHSDLNVVLQEIISEIHVINARLLKSSRYLQFMATWNVTRKILWSHIKAHWLSDGKETEVELGTFVFLKNVFQICDLCDDHWPSAESVPMLSR